MDNILNMYALASLLYGDNTFPQENKGDYKDLLQGNLRETNPSYFKGRGLKQKPKGLSKKQKLKQCKKK